MPEFLDIVAEAEKLKAIYASDPRNEVGHFLVIGEKGSGKSSLIATCPKPILMHSFDPGGTKVVAIKECIARGELIADTRFEVDSMRDPKAYMLWETEFNRLLNIGFFHHIGTYAFDSITTFFQCLIWQVLKKEGRMLPDMTTKTVTEGAQGKGMRIQDWGTVLNHAVDLTRRFSLLPCHTIILGHVGKDKNEVTGELVNELLLPGQSKDQIPIAVEELYVARKRYTSKGVEHYLLTNDDGSWRATTRMGGGGVFSREEEPNIQALLKKAGRPWEDKPLLKGDLV